MPKETSEGPKTSHLYYFLVELGIYGILVVVYLAVISFLLTDLLTHLFYNDLVIYAFLALALIVGQGVLLESLTSFLLDQVKLNRAK